MTPESMSAQTSDRFASIQAPPPHTDPARPLTWGRLYGAGLGLALASLSARRPGPILLVTPDSHTAHRLEQELTFFQCEETRVFPDWETLPYDVFSPHEDIISQRLETLYRLPLMQRGILIVPVTTLMQRLAPRAYLQGHSLILDRGQRLDREGFRARLEDAGYCHVTQVLTHGEYTLRGSLLDLFPMGSPVPYRIDLFDDEIETLRTFDPETQRSAEAVDRIRLLPAREFPFNEQAVKDFRRRFRARFEGDPQASPVYRDVSQRVAHPGIEYYLPLFFEHTETLADYLPDGTLVIATEDVETAARQFEAETRDRYEQRRHDRERPVLPPEDLYLGADTLTKSLESLPRITAQHFETEDPQAGVGINFNSAALPTLSIQARAPDPAESLRRFLDQAGGRILFTAESPGRREYLISALHGFGIQPVSIDHWRAFLESEAAIAITVAPLEKGLWTADPALAIIPEALLFGERAVQRRRRRSSAADGQAAIRNLTDLHLDAPVVHEEHGVGRYRGLQTLRVGDIETEFLTLEYSGGDKLYVPVAALHRIGRYTGASPENAPLHRLGSDQWQQARRRAAERARDVAAELLDIYARRAARGGQAFDVHNDEYAAFAAAFPFEETPDQETAIAEVLQDMAAPRPMDRVVCGDVGFGKTEVAMRAAFVAVENGKQVAVLVPTTLLTQQHVKNFRDRFADWPVRIEALSRFGGRKQQTRVLDDLAAGRADIVIGTHKLLQKEIRFKALGLIIVDEEHRFGVRHKERLKSLRSEVDLLTLTATPIPRTLNMSLSGLRDLSIIATPPVHRHAIKTFVSQWNDVLIQEAVKRELNRGGQVYFLHNEVETIEQQADALRKLLPDAGIQVAHGQMRERELESVMLDYYHQRFNILVCTTIVESGIDVPTANTIIINRADKLGLSQLHQLRGRVGRSHHRAYAYLIAPHRKAMTADAIKRLEAIESLEDLGVGFTLATHDLEIRGAGELLGEEQSGQIHEVGFALYNELLDRAVRALRSGQMPDPDTPLDHGAEVDLGAPALLPEDYVPDVHTRLILYKRISGAADEEELRELQVEMIDRFGLLPDQTKNLFETTRLKLRVAHLGITKLEAGADAGRIVFDAEPRIDPGKLVALIQSQPQTYRFDGRSKLHFTRPMATLEDRVEAVIDIVASVALPEAA